MMKSIALLNDSHHHVDEEGDGFVLVDSPLGFEEDEEFSLVDDAFSCSSLHQTLQVSSLPMESVRDNFFEPAIGQEVFSAAVTESPSMLSDDDDDDVNDGEEGDDEVDDDEDNPLSYRTEDDSGIEIVMPSDLDRQRDMVSSLPSSAPSLGCAEFEISVKEESSAESSPNEDSNRPVESAKAEDAHVDAESSAALTNTSEEAEERGGHSSPASSFVSGRGNCSISSTDDDDGADIAGFNEDKHHGDDEDESNAGSSSRGASKKKRRKQLRLTTKKAAAAAAAAAAMGHLSLRGSGTPPKRNKAKGGGRKKVANIAVACAVQSIAEYKEEVERNKIKKAR